MFHSFRFPWRLCAVLPVALLAACVTQPPRPVTPKIGYVPMAQVKAKAKFDTFVITRANFGEVAKSCITTWPDSGTSRVLADGKFAAARGSTVAHAHSGHASYLVINGDVGVCIQQSEQRHPIIAGEALYKTVNPEGPPPDVTDAWYVQIAEVIAREGTATVIYKFPNGNAQVVKYWIDASSSSPVSLNYWPEFKRSGQWTAAPSDLILEHPAISTVSVVQYSGRHAKNFLSHRS